MPKPLCGSPQTVEKSERDGIPDHLTCLLRNLYTDQEATVRTGHGTTDCFQIRKGVCQGCIFSSYLKVGGGGDDRGRDGWLASPTQWT